MGLYSKAKYVAKVFLKTPNKIALIKKSLRVLKNEGVSGLKQAIKATNQKQESLRDLYEKQQSVNKEYKEHSESILFIIWALQRNVDISDTYRLTALQKKEQDRIVVIKTGEKADWEERIECEKLICDEVEAHECIRELLTECEQDYIYFIKGGNYLAPNMRDEFAEVIYSKKPSVIFSDECVFDADNGKIVRYDVKPDFSEYDLYQGNQRWQSVMYARELVVELFEMSVAIGCMENMMLNLMLNVARETREIVHINQVLLLKKNILEEHNLAEQRWIVAQHLKKLNVPVNVTIENDRLRLHAYKGQYKVSIIILAEELEQARQCVEDVLHNTANADYELLVTGETELLEHLTEGFIESNLIRGISCKKEMSYVERCNVAASKAIGDILIFIQEDMRVQHVEWLAELLGVFSFKQTGAASPKIVRGDNTLRYAGMIAGGFGFTAIPFNGEKNLCVKNVNEPAFFNRQVSVLSASCLAVRRDIFETIGGFDETNFTDKFSNAQLSFEIARAGYTCVYCANSVLVAKGEEWYDSWYDKEHPSAYLNLLKNYGEELSEDAYFTESMKHLYLRGVPVDFRIYQKKNEIRENKGSILMVSHDSLLGGATIAFQYAARVLKKSGYYVVWIVENKGAMLEELEREGISYIVDPSFKGSDVWLNYAKNFDLIVCSTILLCSQVEELKNIGRNVIWWVHEAQDYYTTGAVSGFTRKNLDKLDVWCGGTFAQKTFEENFPEIPTEVMVYGVPDYAGDENVYHENVIENPMDKMIFLSIGTIESRKGQDILAEAIRKLKEEVREQSLFVFIGKVVQENVYAKVQGVAEEYPESVILMEPVNRDMLMQMYHQGDVVLCTSREDPMPVFMTECMMQSKVPICSENTGTAGVLTDGYDGYIYHNNSVDELAQKITYVLKNQNELQQVRVNARKTYEKNFSMEVFEKKLQICVKKILEE